jgi:hypothetical protein
MTRERRTTRSNSDSFQDALPIPTLMQSMRVLSPA